MKNPLFGEDTDESDYFWCEHCERVYRAMDWASNNWRCPGGECGGDALDAIPWRRDRLDKYGHPEYPDFPVIGARYSFS